MSPSKSLTRTAIATATVLAALTWGTPSEASAAEPAATVGDVTCADEQGSFSVTVRAGDVRTSFGISVEDSFEQEILYEERVLAPGATAVIAVPDLEDDDYTATVDAHEISDEDEIDADDGQTPVPPPDTSGPDILVETQRAVSCDPAPVGPYSNARGILESYCSDQVEVHASNRPIGGNTADLQPVEFTVHYLPSGDAPTEEPAEEPGEEPTEEPGEEGTEEAPRLSALDPVVLDTFTLDAGTPRLNKTYGTAGFEFTGALSLTADGKEIAATEVGYCEAAPASGNGTGTPGGLPNTGA